MLNDNPILSNTNLNNDSNNILTPAEKHYLNHLKAVKKYQNKNRDKINSQNILYYSKIKNENDTTQYNDILEQKKNHYINNKIDILDKKKQYYIENKDSIKQKKNIYYHTVIKPQREKEILLKLQNNTS